MITQEQHQELGKIWDKMVTMAHEIAYSEYSCSADNAECIIDLVVDTISKVNKALNVDLDLLEYKK